MRREEIQRLADALGILGTDRMSVSALIRSIQFEEGLIPCYCEAWSAPCRIDECPFSTACSSHARIRSSARH